VKGERVATYVSTPITNGPRYFRWRTESGCTSDSPDFSLRHQAEVIAENIRIGSEFAEALACREHTLVINPGVHFEPGWRQADYHEFWLRVVTEHTRRIVFIDGWELSIGCVLEFSEAMRFGIPCFDQMLQPITLKKGLALLRSSLGNTTGDDAKLQELRGLAEQLARLEKADNSIRQFYKDQVLDSLAAYANVAQFVSFSPNLEIRYARIKGFEPNHRFGSAEEAIAAILARSPERSVNIRTFDPQRPQGNPFIEELETVPDVLALLQIHCKQNGLYAIVNERMDPRDGGVSGVCAGKYIAFAPDATPRVIDDHRIAKAILPKELGIAMLSLIYGPVDELAHFEGQRIEFSVHPIARGWKPSQVTIWQAQFREHDDIVPSSWPNSFSRFLGDKAFGLILAASAGFRVPRATLYHRRLRPFNFGIPTGSGQCITRPCPVTKYPGFYTTIRGWSDPKAALEDWRILAPQGTVKKPEIPLQSILVQDAVEAAFSGVALSGEISGRAGKGDKLMVGDDPPEFLPCPVVDAVSDLHTRLVNTFGNVRMEWVFNGVDVWIVQMNKMPDAVRSATIEDKLIWRSFRYEQGMLEEFRHFVAQARADGVAVEVIGNISSLSHVGEIVQDSGVPYRFINP
jgi:hypothetical protein